MGLFLNIILPVFLWAGLNAFADQPEEEVEVTEQEVVEDLESYYAPYEALVGDPYDLEELFSLSEEPNRTPSNAFKYKITSGRGRRGSGFHKGIDYGAPCGTKVPSRSKGVVTKAGTGTGYGKVVGVRTNGCTHIYAHLSRINVRVGQTVSTGTLVGISGNTGRSRGRTGCHLHYESCSKNYSNATKSGKNASGKKTKKGRSKAKR